MVPTIAVAEITWVLNRVSDICDPSTDGNALLDSKSALHNVSHRGNLKLSSSYILKSK